MYKHQLTESAVKLLNMRDKIDTESLKVYICIIVTASADEVTVSVAVIIMISEVTQIYKHWLAESAVKLMKYDWDLRWN